MTDWATAQRYEIGDTVLVLAPSGRRWWQFWRPRMAWTRFRVER